MWICYFVNRSSVFVIPWFLIPEVTDVSKRRWGGWKQETFAELVCRLQMEQSEEGAASIKIWKNFVREQKTEPCQQGPKGVESFCPQPHNVWNSTWNVRARAHTQFSFLHGHMSSVSSLAGTRCSFRWRKCAEQVKCDLDFLPLRLTIFGFGSPFLTFRIHCDAGEDH